MDFPDLLDASILPKELPAIVRGGALSDFVYRFTTLRCLKMAHAGLQVVSPRLSELYLLHALDLSGNHLSGVFPELHLPLLATLIVSNQRTNSYDDPLTISGTVLGSFLPS